MKIIFLDIDGVLVVRFRRDDQYGSGFHPQFVENLRRIVAETGAYLVISSTWRSNGLTELLEMWEARALPGFIMDVTGHARGQIYSFDRAIYDGKAQDLRTLSLPRGVEIQEWLSRVGKFQRINWSQEVQEEYCRKAVVKNYVILDDDSDMLLCQAEHFVKCSNRWDEPDAEQGYGLTSRAADEAIRILNSTPMDLYYGKENT